MTEVGKVIKTDGRYATVRIDKKEECGKCGMCLFAQNASFTDMRAQNFAGAKQGDSVIVENGGDAKLIGSLLLFLVPLMLIGVAAAISILVIKKEIWILLLSLIFIVSWYTILGFFDKKLCKKDKFCVKVVKILEKGENENDTNNGQSGVL